MDEELSGVGKLCIESNHEGGGNMVIRREVPSSSFAGHHFHPCRTTTWFFSGNFYKSPGHRFGIPPENIQKLFTPFFTTKREVEGIGLGLAVSYDIVQRHGGRIKVQGEVDKGSTFTVCLPLRPGKT